MRNEILSTGLNGRKFRLDAVSGKWLSIEDEGDDRKAGPKEGATGDEVYKQDSKLAEEVAAEDASCFDVVEADMAKEAGEVVPLHDCADDEEVVYCKGHYVLIAAHSDADGGPYEVGPFGSATEAQLWVSGFNAGKKAAKGEVAWGIATHLVGKCAHICAPQGSKVVNHPGN